MNAQWQLRLFGVVQGVALRFMVEQEAQRLGLTGFVKNMPDGSVAIVAAGPPKAIDTLLQWLRSNPGHSRVTRLVKKELATKEAFEDFIIVY